MFGRSRSFSYFPYCHRPLESSTGSKDQNFFFLPSHHAVTTPGFGTGDETRHRAADREYTIIVTRRSVGRYTFRGASIYFMDFFACSTYPFLSMHTVPERSLVDSRLEARFVYLLINLCIVHILSEWVGPGVVWTSFPFSMGFIIFQAYLTYREFSLVTVWFAFGVHCAWYV